MSDKELLKIYQRIGEAIGEDLETIISMHPNERDGLIVTLGLEESVKKAQGKGNQSSKTEEEDDGLTSPSLKTKETSQESFKGRLSGVKRKLSFASSEVDNNDINEADREDPSDVDIGSIYSILQEMGEGDQKDRDGEENITKDVVSKNDSSSMVLNDQARDGPSYKVY